MNHFLFSPWVWDFEDNDEKEAKAVLDAFKERLDWEKVRRSRHKVTGLQGI
jgi:hypothetical protein